MKYLLLLIVLLSAASCSRKPLPTAANVDLKRYAGKWYEIASLPQRFQKGCSCTYADYTLREDGTVNVFNSCKKGDRLKTISGKAFPETKGDNSRLKVRFNFLARGKYYIVELPRDYSYAVVGHPNRKYLWILSRTPMMHDTTFTAILGRMRTLGFPIDDIKGTRQGCK